ncbi:WD40 repeat-like protein [Eremomyces bilateralis CBS 781.70]|uniref:WD40 repeat-like protein n=1 Tax=Eremomyces bilateralis CBS 781.70 TaxID=1392243 RepID=A0A6G1G7S2_9PEZI|nr:WD40 repeat-like protein [Eremomyces bilateralis CBS 781.70]KAF1813899.1 WD40 repeat-like protein [Eremomyces bilateralis CBS 781.70]
MSSQFPTKRIAVLTGHNGPVHAVTYSSGLGQYILTGSSDRLVRLYNPSTSPSPGPIQTYHAHGHTVLDLSISTSNARFASVGGDRLVFLWDVASATTLRRFGGHVGRVNAVAFAGDDDTVLASGSFDGTVRLWDCKSNSSRALMTLSEARDAVVSVAVVGADVYAGGADGRVRVYDVRMGMQCTDVVGAAVTHVEPTKLGEAYLVGSADSRVRFMERGSGKCLMSYKAEDYKSEGLRLRCALGPGERTVVAGGEEGKICVWDTMEGTLLHVLEHEGPESKASKKILSETAQKERKVVSAVAVCKSQSKKEWCSAGGNGEVVVWGLGR